MLVVSPLLGVICDKLRSPLVREFGLLWGVQKDLEKLSRTTSIISMVLQDAELQQIHDVIIRNWLRELKDVAYEADDVIDECIAEALLSQDSDVDSGSCTTQVCDYFSACIDFKRIMLRHKLAKRIKEIREKFDEIASERRMFQLIERGSVEGFPQYEETDSNLLENCVYGRDLDKEKIVAILLNDASSRDNLLVCSVIGMGGLGKTTLAQCVYNDARIENNFHARIWICITEDFRASKIIKTVIESLSGETCELENLDELQNRLKELLRGKKFLLVLDDVWNEDPQKWDMIKFPLECGAKGSSIIVTTRSSMVAEIMGVLPVNQHYLAPLSDEECWSLFKGMAFGAEVIENSELERIGKEIVKRIGGVPLAAKALGGSLRSVREVNEWISISTREIWMLREDSGILTSLILSYNHLSAELRQCFTFCSIFPKNHIINVAELIQLWMANGLVQSEGTLDMEYVGRRTFDILLCRSFFQDVMKEYDGQLTCKMHDLMHDLACYVAEKECLAFCGGDDLAKIPKSIRHLSSSPDPNSIPVNILKCLSKSNPLLRTFLLTRPFHYELHDIEFKNLKCLRVLDLSNTNLKYIPKSIGKMHHLRYINLSCSAIVHLPSSLCRLKALQTLKLRDCYELKMLPENVNSLVNLLHLDLWGCHSLIQMPLGIGELVGLRTLGTFFVGLGNGRSIKELCQLNKLGGRLKIGNLEHVRDASEAGVANLEAKTNLEDISFSWTAKSEENINSRVVLEALRPHQDLSGKLTIHRYGGSSFPSWIQLLEKLVEIYLLDCFKCEDLPPLGHLPLLKRLKIEGMNSLKRINKEFYGPSTSSQIFFPSLQQLVFNTMLSWEEWEALEHKQAFPCLENLSVYECPNLSLLPSTILSSIQSLYVSGCDEIIVTSLPCLRVLSLCGLSSTPVGSLRNLDALESLQLSDCKFSSLPQEIGNLASLKSLEIS